jgi:26 proteasome complex subunit DSS1
MSASASTSKAVASAETENEPTKELASVPTLGVLEEDDEFEEFPVQGAYLSFIGRPGASRSTHVLSSSDWDDSQTHMAKLGGAAPGAAQSGGNKLWEDNWDDDDVEEDFSVQLRCVLDLGVIDGTER